MRSTSTQTSSPSGQRSNTVLSTLTPQTGQKPHRSFRALKLQSNQHSVTWRLLDSDPAVTASLSQKKLRSSVIPSLSDDYDPPYFSQSSINCPFLLPPITLAPLCESLIHFLPLIDLEFLSLGLWQCGLCTKAGLAKLLTALSFQVGFRGLFRPPVAHVGPWSWYTLAMSKHLPL